MNFKNIQYHFYNELCIKIFMKHIIHIILITKYNTKKATNFGNDHKALLVSFVEKYIYFFKEPKASKNIFGIKFF